MLTAFLLTIFIVGFVTAGLTIRFDRFFTTILLLFLFHLGIQDAVNVFLWVILFGALAVILQNKEKLNRLPGPMKKKLFGLVPLFTFIAAYLGSWLFFSVTANTLIIILGVLAILYGLRLIFIHFQQHEMEFEQGHPTITKICGLLGPWIRDFLLGLSNISQAP